MNLKYKDWHVAALIIALHTALTVFLSARLNLWLDEMYTWHTSSGDVASAYKNALDFEGQPPFYFILITIWRKILDTAFFARLLSVISVTLSLIVIYRTTRKYFTDINGFLVLLLFAVNPVMIWAGSEMRCYALVILLASLELHYFFKVYMLNPQDKSGRIIFILISVLGVFTQYFFAFLLVGNFVYLLTRRKRNLVLRYLTDMIVPVAILIVVAYPYLNQQIREHTNSLTQDTISLKGSISFILTRMESYLVPFDIVPYRRIIRWLMRLFLFSAAGYMIIRWIKGKINLSADDNLYFHLLITTLTVAVIFALIRYKLLPESLLMPRHTLILLIPFAYLFVCSLLLIPARQVQNLLLILLAVTGVFKVYVSNKDLVKDRDIPALVNYIESNERPEQPILIYPYYFALPFEYYYTGINEVHAVPKPINLSSKFMNEDYIIGSDEEFLAIVKEQTGNAADFWYVTSTSASNEKLFRDMQRFADKLSTEYIIKTKQEYRYNLYLYRFIAKQ